jgi:hypothetical protein
MAPEESWFIRRERQGVENAIMTENRFLAVDCLA